MQLSKLAKANALCQMMAELPEEGTNTEQEAEYFDTLMESDELPDDYIIYDPFDGYGYEWFKSHLQNLAENFQTVIDKVMAGETL